MSAECSSRKTEIQDKAFEKEIEKKRTTRNATTQPHTEKLGRFIELIIQCS